MSRTFILLMVTGLGLPLYLSAPHESYAQATCEESQPATADVGQGSTQSRASVPRAYSTESSRIIVAQRNEERRPPPCERATTKPAHAGDAQKR